GPPRTRFTHEHSSTVEVHAGSPCRRSRSGYGAALIPQPLEDPGVLPGGQPFRPRRRGREGRLESVLHAVVDEEQVRARHCREVVGRSVQGVAVEYGDGARPAAGRRDAAPAGGGEEVFQCGNTYLLALERG